MIEEEKKRKLNALGIYKLNSKQIRSNKSMDTVWSDEEEFDQLISNREMAKADGFRTLEYNSCLDDWSLLILI